MIQLVLENRSCPFCLFVFSLIDALMFNVDLSEIDRFLFEAQCKLL